ncbi:MAG: hypothetical protein E7359_04325 [Clostridiales bacterium]|nr:hypothetical protein [Clostridiales bacterium]
MKIVIKKIEWHAIRRTGEISKKETYYKFNDIEKEKKLFWADWGEYFESANICIKGAMPRIINFSIKVKELNKDSVVLEVSGEAGGEQKEDSFGYTSKLITLKLNENMGFATKTKDFGINFEISLLEDEKQENLERMNFREFNHLFRMCSDLDKAEISIYAPLLYKMEDKYYNACIEFLKNNTITYLKANEISTNDIIEGYYRENKKDKKKYIESLMILNNLEKADEMETYQIFNPYVIE